MKVKQKKTAYMQTNIELAQENGQLKQQLGQYINDHAEQTERIMRLKNQVNELTSIKAKYDHIVRIVLNIENPTSNQTVQADSFISTTETLHEAEDNQPNEQPCQSESRNHSTRDLSKSANNINLQRITEHSEDDSLLPPDNISVSPLRPERIFHTPSIWRILDNTRDKPNETNESRASQINDKETNQVVTEGRPETQPEESTHTAMENNAINSASPIQPIGVSRGLDNNPVFHSTPVLARRLQNIQDQQYQIDIIEHSTYIQHPKDTQSEKDQSPLKTAEKPVDKAQPARGKKRAAKPASNMNEESTLNSEQPRRYNLRKRTKQQVA